MASSLGVDVVGVRHQRPPHQALLLCFASSSAAAARAAVVVRRCEARRLLAVHLHASAAISNAMHTRRREIDRTHSCAALSTHRSSSRGAPRRAGFGAPRGLSTSPPPPTPGPRGRRRRAAGETTAAAAAARLAVAAVATAPCGWLLPPVGSWGAVGEGGYVLVGVLGGRWFGVGVGRRKAGQEGEDHGFNRKRINVHVARCPGRCCTQSIPP